MATAQHVVDTHFLELNNELLIFVGSFLDVRSFVSLTRACQRLYELERNFANHIWHHRVISHYGNLRLPAPNSSWKDLAISLYLGYGHYYGFTLDAFTSGFMPYPMHLEVLGSNDETSEDSGLSYHNIHWPTLRNSITKIRIDGKTWSSNGLRTFSFTEIELMRGSNILVPNSYMSYNFGPSLVGVFPNGAFFLLRQEAISESRLHHARESERGVTTATMKEGTELSGIVVHELSEFDNFQLYRQPLSKKEYMELDLGEVVAPWDEKKDMTFGQRNRGKIILKDSNGACSTFQVMVGFGVPTLSPDNDPPSYDLLIYQFQKSGESFLSPDLGQFMEDCTMYGWFHGDCIIGLVKDRAKNKTASFFLQTKRREGTSVLLDLKTALEVYSRENSL